MPEGRLERTRRAYGRERLIDYIIQEKIDTAVAENDVRALMRLIYQVQSWAMLEEPTADTPWAV
jgi:hypothetical protein